MFTVIHIPSPYQLCRYLTAGKYNNVNINDEHPISVHIQQGKHNEYS